MVSSKGLAKVGGVKRCTYVLTLGIASFQQFSKDVPKKRVRTIDLSSYRNYPEVIILITPREIHPVFHSNALQLFFIYLIKFIYRTFTFKLFIYA